MCQNTDTIILFVQTPSVKLTSSTAQYLIESQLNCLLYVKKDSASSDIDHPIRRLFTSAKNMITVIEYTEMFFSINLVLPLLDTYKYILYLDNTHELINFFETEIAAKCLLEQNNNFHRVSFIQARPSLLCQTIETQRALLNYDTQPDNNLSLSEHIAMFEKITEANTIFSKSYLNQLKHDNIHNTPTCQYINTFHVSYLHWRYFTPSLISIAKLQLLLDNSCPLIQIPHFEYIYSIHATNLGFKSGYIRPKEELILFRSPSVRTPINSLNTTIVTAFIELDITRPPKRKTAVYNYMDKCAPTLSIPQPMIIYVSESIISSVYNFRDQLGLTDLTQIIKVSQNDLYQLCNLAKIEENVQKNNPPYNIAKYILAVNTRYILLKQSIECNTFNTEYFAWVDFSAGHVVNIPKGTTINYTNPERVRISAIGRVSEWVGQPSIKEVNRFAYDHKCCGGGVFVAHKIPMLELIKRHNEEFERLMYAGFCINDDKLLFIIFTKYPYMFDIFVSGYKSIISKL